MNQLLTYADVRDIVEERLEKNKQFRSDLKALQLVEKKRDQEYMATKLKMQKEMKEDQQGLKDALEKLEREAERKQVENNRKIAKLMKGMYEGQPFLGYVISIYYNLLRSILMYYNLFIYYNL